MFAVIATGGKQHRVAPGDVVSVERLSDDKTFEFTDVLCVKDKRDLHIGAPKVKDAVVKAELVAQARHQKVLIFKKKRRNNYRRLNGHRQRKTIVRITDILVGGKSIH